MPGAYKRTLSRSAQRTRWITFHSDLLHQSLTNHEASTEMTNFRDPNPASTYSALQTVLSYL